MASGSVLVVEDDPALREALCDTLELAGYPTLSAEDGRAAINVLNKEQINMVVSDVQMKPMDGAALLKKIKEIDPKLPVVLMTAYGSIQKAVQAMREGAIDYLVKPFEAEVLVNMVSRLVLDSGDKQEHDLIAEDEESKDLLILARRVAQSDATVLLMGESGVGKEVYAQYIHRYSGRSKGPFVAINCAAIPENMLEAVLFGYEKGAFTGAYSSNAGKFEQANGGTILLDEISEMDLGLQAKLLRVLQEREVERLGSKKQIKLDVRVIATTNRDLREEVNGARFREDLYYRLNVFPLHLLPLRDRPGDILPLARRMIERELKPGQEVPELTTAAEQKLLSHAWPGNVRELGNVIQRAMILCNANRITDEEIYFETQANGEMLRPVPSPALPARTDAAGAQADPVPLDAPDDLKSREQQMILQVLREESGSRKKTAQRLGISPRTLRYKLAKMREAGIQIPD